MTIKSEEIILKNLGGKAFHVFMNCFFLIIFFLLSKNILILPIWMFSFLFYSVLFGFKSLKVRKEGIKIVYHLRPFFREINCPVKSIRKIRFSLSGGGNFYPNMMFSLKRFPFFFEIRLDKKDEVEDVIELLCTNGDFKIKALSDKRIMKIRLIEICKNSNCKAI